MTMIDIIESKYVDHIYEFEGLWNRPSLCGLKIVTKENKSIIIATGLYNENPGTSVTDWCCQLATDLCNDNNLDQNNLVFIERTPDTGSKLSFYHETFYIVNFEWNGEKFLNPDWQTISKAEVDKLIKD